MPLPGFFFAAQSRIEVPVSTPVISATKFLREGVGLAPAARPLPFRNSLQEQNNWCWAAVSFAVARYYDPHTLWTQCRIASEELHLPCCSAPLPVACDVYGYLTSSLSRVGHLNPAAAPAPLAIAFLDAEINGQGRPVCLRIAWTGGGAHFVTLRGIDGTSATAQLAVSDPWFGDAIWPYALFPSTYQGGGSWTHSYLTQPNPLAL